MLSEISPKTSLQNFIEIRENLSEAEFNNVKYVDLRDIKKILIAYH